MLERTLAIIKPDAVKLGVTGSIIQRIESEGFEILEIIKIKPWTETMMEFYKDHSEKSFYKGLVEFMTSGKIVVMVLEKENAIFHWRKIMGATDPAKADDLSIRSMWGSREIMSHNCVHGSDSQASAEREIKLMFAEVGDGQ